MSNFLLDKNVIYTDIWNFRVDHILREGCLSFLKYYNLVKLLYKDSPNGCK